jgi:MFS family permease
VLTLCTIGCYAMSLAPVAWVLISEIFPNRVRGLAVSIAVSALWIACFVLTFTFPVLNAALGASGTFWLYAAICFAGFVFVKRCVPETKGRSLEEIERDLTAPRLRCWCARPRPPPAGISSGCSRGSRNEGYGGG